MSRIYLGALLWLWVLSPACAEVDAKLLAAPLVEDFRETLPISGSVVAGVMVAKPSDDAITAPYAYMPTTASELVVCALIRTRDGRYRSENNYIVPARYQGFVRFEYPSKYERFFRSLTVDDIAVLISLGRCDERMRSELFLAAWGAPIDSFPRNILIAANSGRKRLTIDTDVASDTITQDCTVLTSGVRRVFDSWCHLPLPDHLPEVAQIKLTEWRAGERVGFTVVRLRFAF